MSPSGAKNLSTAVLSAADGIRNKEIERRAASEFLREISEKRSGEVLKESAEPEKPLFIKVGKDEPDFKILGVDGGLLKEQYHGVDLILIRAVGVLFEYSRGKLKNHSYFPSKNPAPEPKTIVDAESEMDFLLAVNIIRPKKEFEIALDSAKALNPEHLVMHGSILPHPANKAGEGSSLRADYLEMLSAYKSLYSYCLKNGIFLSGVVEDSRENRFYSSVSDSPGAPKTNCRDSVILFDSLSPGERTCAFSHPGKSQLGEGGLGEFARMVYTIYLRSAEFDRPLKIDFLSEPEKVGEVADRIASAIYNTSRFNRSYGLPTVIIEADARAKLSEEDIELIFQQISDRAGATPLSMALRRKQRPF